MINWSYFITSMSFIYVSFSNINYQATHRPNINTNITGYAFSLDKGSEIQYALLMTDIN